MILLNYSRFWKHNVFFNFRTLLYWKCLQLTNKTQLFKQNVLFIVSFGTLSAYWCIGVKLSQRTFLYMPMNSQYDCVCPQWSSINFLMTSSPQLIMFTTKTYFVCNYFELLKQMVLLLASFFLWTCIKNITLIKSTRNQII